MNCLKTVLMVVMEFVAGGSLSSYLDKIEVSTHTLLWQRRLSLISLSLSDSEEEQVAGSHHEREEADI